ncbi:transposase [Haemophilus influenzae]|uniref:transposase n=1 Tax=Haemophilus influenzae TaxID=727 RepID=UPI000D0096BD|nr:transposase [Haemophilus influenzae]AWP53402.1 hypothetical protein DLJ98_00485 [Haemophilus influenzae]
MCKDFKAKLAEFNGEDDHVHLLVEYPLKVIVSTLKNILKDLSNQMIRKKKIPIHLQKKLCANQL